MAARQAPGVERDLRRAQRRPARGNLGAAELVIPLPLLQNLDDVSATPFGYPYKFMYDVQKSW